VISCCAGHCYYSVYIHVDGNQICFFFLFHQVLDSFFIVLSDSGDVFFVSENVYNYLGYTQVQFFFSDKLIVCIH